MNKRIPTLSGRSILSAACLAAVLSFASAPASAEPICRVVVCNKLERLTLSPLSMIKDKIGETCSETMVGKDDAVAGKILTSSTRWYQGGFNPTKASVTRVKSVGVCGDFH